MKETNILRSLSPCLRLRKSRRFASGMNSTPYVFLALAAVLQCTGAVAAAADVDARPPPMSLPVVGGTNTNRAIRRHVAFLVKRTSNGSDTTLSTCSGLLVSHRFVLTSAHCLAPPADGHGHRLQSVAIWMNLHNLKFNEAFLRHARYASAVYVHRWYQPDTQLHDLALLRLNKHFRNGARPVLLPRRHRMLPYYSDVLYAGFGDVDGNGTRPHFLQVTTLKNRDFRFCASIDRISRSLARTLLCATAPAVDKGGTGICLGDGGGPLFTKAKAGRIRLFGVASHIRGPCGAPFTTNYFTRIVFYLADIARALNGSVAANWKEMPVSKPFLKLDSLDALA